VIAGHWLPVRDGDPRALALYLRHYSAKKARARYRTVLVGNHARFVGNGEHMVLLTRDCRSMFAWRLQAFRKDGQYGIECAVFRRESPGLLSSELISEACELAWSRWPGKRLFTFVDPREIASSNPGYCFKRAGFVFCGRTKRGLHVLELLPPAEEIAA
jgi:hypothetical protein